MATTPSSVSRGVVGSPAVFGSPGGVDSTTAGLCVLATLRSSGQLDNDSARVLVEMCLEGAPAVMALLHVFEQTNDEHSLMYGLSFIARQEREARATKATKALHDAVSPFARSLDATTSDEPAATPHPRSPEEKPVPAQHPGSSPGGAATASEDTTLSASGAGAGAGAGAAADDATEPLATPPPVTTMRGRSLSVDSWIGEKPLPASKHPTHCPTPIDDVDGVASSGDEADDLDLGVTVLYYARDQLRLAEAAARASKGRVMLQEIKWGTFNDGFPDLFICGVKALPRHHVGFLASFHDRAAIFEQLSAIYSLPRYMAKSFTVVLPYYPTGTMERIQRVGEVATAASLARMLSVIPHSKNGPTSICVLDIHTLSQRFYFTDNVHIRLRSAVGLLRKMLTHRRDTSSITVCFPDEGACKRFGKKFPSFPQVTCSKIRKGSKRIVTISDGEPHARHCVIVDDLVQSGGTLIECAKALKAAGADKVSAYVTHAVFPKESWRKFANNKLFYRFWITDSIPTSAAAVRGVRPFELISLGGLVANLFTNDPVLEDYSSS